MTLFGKLKTIAFSDRVQDITNNNGKSLYSEVLLNWTKPQLWERGSSAPKGPRAPSLYIIMRDHGNSGSKKNICYVGLTKNPASRFGNHETAKMLVQKNGQTFISYAAIDFMKGKNKEKRTKTTMEQIEHILIWTLDAWLENDKKMSSLPGTGKANMIPWHITNKGFRFHGTMPPKIIFPTISIEHGRNRSGK